MRNAPPPPPHPSPSAHRSLGVLCVHLSQFSADFARDLTAARAPFGRLLDTHGVKRVVQAHSPLPPRARYIVMRPSRFLPWSSAVCAELWPRRSASPQALKARAIVLPTASGAAWCSCGWRAATRMRCCAAASPGCWHVTRGAGARGRASASAAGGACCCSSYLTVKLFRMLRGLSRCRSLLLSFAIVCFSLLLFCIDGRTLLLSGGSGHG